MSLISFGFIPVQVDISQNWWVDSFDSYELTTDVENYNWNSGNETTSSTMHFDGKWEGGQNIAPNTHGRDFFDFYNIDDDLDGLNRGFYWSMPWVSLDNEVPSWYGLEDYHSYDTSVSLDGLNNGNNWSSSWGAQNNYVPDWYGQENYDSYDTGSSLLGLDGGLYFDAAWVTGSNAV